MNKGIDAPLVPFLLCLGGLALIGLGLVPPIEVGMSLALQLAGGLYLIACGCVFIHTSLVGKEKIWDKVLNQNKIDSTAKCLDIGCGNGLVMFKLAKVALNGKVVGIDIWRSRDQSNNSKRKVETNIRQMNLDKRVEVLTADMREMPFDTDSFDVVASSLAIHNVKPAKEREKALREIARVLKDSGKLLLVDMERKDNEYISVLKSLGFSHFAVQYSGFNGWWGGPWAPTFVLVASR
ncbi:class I SAM-dependent methyltransferase [Loigolactobacillus backii]|uniref:Uncharacterized protein n=1 Tax=Loigolactobacillus backii TaxID=375175 RepID=A0A192H1V6_9LACO|nr:class I SAM-dependent methyltransferase [Loigolactobacillus backii]ANK60213.1 hypothetical protein AYR52_08145 [Loigolactobacillus backii]ANK62345.1 hypothetical protein AYR53_05845 [Loigolactobacillus backii]ANK65095.1 hypothetical protein AYR54_07555 [Loigolactobacillus backii]ANK67654.1 hypothetical protein AYR55_08160 [Loigolactobacillus backii]ANK70643.1 hypothetical protein AYR56_11145 [Loigolactobacillus backii]